MRALRAFALTTALAVVTGCSAGDGRAALSRPAPSPTRPAVAPTPPPEPPCADQAGDAGLARCLHGVLTRFWSAQFTEVGLTYRPATLVVPDRDRFTGKQGAYLANRAFYDENTIHLPTGYLSAIHAAFGPRAPVAIAFAMAHETGHRVQGLLGVFDRANARALKSDAGSRRVELQADCFAGVWAHAEVTAGRFDHDRFAGVAGAEVSRLSRDTSGGRIDPSVEVRTHGSEALRMTWLGRGLDSGDPGSCRAFGGSGATVRLPWAVPTGSP